MTVKPKTQSPVRAKALPGPSDKTARSRALVQTMETRTMELRKILDAETLALSESNIPAFFALQEQKETVARDWHSALVDIAGLKHEKADGFGPDLKEKLESLRIEMAGTVARNRMAIERSNRSMARLSDRMITHTRRAAEERSRLSYSAAGQMRSDSKRTLSMGISESA